MTTTDTGADTAPDAPTTTADTATTGDTATDTAAEAAKWKALAQKHEERAKANAAAVRELEALKRSSMTDQEKAVAVAKAEGRTEAMREAGVKLAEAQIRVSAAGRAVDVEALLEGVDAVKFLDGNGDPDVKAIGAWVDRVAPAAPTDPARPTRRDLGGGARGGQTPSGGPAQEFADLINGQLRR